MPTTIIDTEVDIKGETFDLCAIPGENTRLVKQSKANVLKNLDLDKLVSNLERSASLLFLAYNGVAGFGELRAKTNKLQDDLGILCRDAELALDKFSIKTTSVLGNLKDTFKWLTQGKEKLALGYLSAVAKTASEMANEAQALARKFDELADKTREVCSATEIQQGKTAEEKKKLEEKLNEIKALNAQAQIDAKNFADLQKEMKDLYEEAKAKAETAESRAFALAITSAVMTPIADGVGAFAGAYARMQSGPAMPPSLPAKPENAAPNKEEEEKSKKDGELAAAKKAQEEADGVLLKTNDEVTTAQQAVNEKDAAVKVKEKVLTDAKNNRDNADDATAKQELEKKVSEAETALNAAKAELDEANNILTQKQEAKDKAEKVAEEKQKKAKIAEAAAQAAVLALEKAAQRMAEVGESYMELASKYEETRKDYLNKYLKYKEQEAQRLGEMEKYAIQMSTVTNEAGIKKTVSESLIQAVKAFNEVSQILRTAAQFWYQMAEACKAVGPDSQLQRNLTLYTESLSAEDRVAVYTDAEFKTQVVEYMASWKALELICADYSRAAAKTRDNVQANIARSPSPEESMKITAGLAKELIKDAKLAEESVNADIAVIAKEAQAAAIAARN